MKPQLLLNILLAFVWGAVNASLAPSTLVVGFIFGYLVILLFDGLLGGDGRYGFRFFYWIRLTLWLLREIVLSSFRVAWTVLSPSLKDVNPGIFGIPLDVETDASITLMANLISLTPGTLSIDISHDRKTIYIHDMYIDDGDVAREASSIYREVERRVQIAMDSPSRHKPMSPRRPPEEQSYLDEQIPPSDEE